MFIVVQILHVLVSITLILFILLQTGKGSDLGAMLGGGGANTLFGAAGATSFLSKLTRYAAIIFMFTCLTLAYISAHPATAMESGSSVMPDQSGVVNEQAVSPADAQDAAGPEEPAAQDVKEVSPADSDDVPAETQPAAAADSPAEGGDAKTAAPMEPQAEGKDKPEGGEKPLEGEKTE